MFDTALGPCGIAWGERGIVAVQLPEATAEGTRARLLRLHSGAMPSDPPPDVLSAVGSMVALLAGEVVDLRDIPLDLHGVSEFHRRVYDVVRGIPRASTLTYGAVATTLGDSRAAQAVGRALGKNPCPIIVPCHRVLASNGRLGGFSGAGGTRTKHAMLLIEGALPAELF